MRSQEWKWDRRALYRLASDRGETADVAHTYPGMAKKLRRIKIRSGIGRLSGSPPVSTRGRADIDDIEEMARHRAPFLMSVLMAQPEALLDTDVLLAVMMGNPLAAARAGEPIAEHGSLAQCWRRPRPSTLTAR